MASGFKSGSSIGNIDHPQLFAQTRLKIQDHQGDVTIMLQDMSDVDIEIPKCATIGFIENIKNDFFKEISQIDQESAQQKFPSTFLCQNLLTKEKQEHFF